MRQSLFQRFFTWPFYLPLAVLGIPPQFFLMHMGLNLMYQFWIHTELIDGFGPVFNYIFNTPKPWSQNTFFPLFYYLRLCFTFIMEDTVFILNFFNTKFFRYEKLNPIF